VRRNEYAAYSHSQARTNEYAAYSHSQARASALITLQACLNGPRAPDEHPALPLTPAQLAADARACVDAGARSLHLHPRDATGAESLDAAVVAAALRAVRAAAGGVEISLSTGLWIAGGDAERRQALVAGWTERPDLVSLNLSEPGWEALAELLAERAIGVEAGLATTADAEALAGGPLRPVRVLVEIDDDGLGAEPAVAAAAQIDAVLDGAGVERPRLHHGYGPATWAVLAAAVPLGHDIRVGLEDVLELPGGAIAPGNPALVAAARDLAADIGQS
jgi:uncharacterized protein (DUF849 family)